MARKDAWAGAHETALRAFVRALAAAGEELAANEQRRGCVQDDQRGCRGTRSAAARSAVLGDTLSANQAHETCLRPRYYRPRDIELLRAIKHLLYKDGYTIKGVQRVLKEQGAGALAAMTDAAESGPLDFSGPEGQEETRLQGLLPEGEDVGSIPRTLRASGPALAESTSVAGRDDTAGKTGDEPPWGLSLTEADIERLRAALAELAECENILGAARRR